jgi:hypothetical protein
VRAAEVALVGALVHEHPWLMPILQEHLDDNEGELLPHLLIAGIERWAEAQLGSGDRDTDQLERVLDYLERAYAERVDVQELIYVSFLEHFPNDDEPFSELRTMVGPHLREQLEAIG